jgi:hypothetical protein
VRARKQIGSHLYGLACSLPFSDHHATERSEERVVTRYAFDEERGILLASWSTGAGDVASVVAEVALPPELSATLRLADRLTGLSQALWRCYTHPASAAPSPDVNTAGWRRELNREAFESVLPALAKPNLPSSGTMLISYNPVVESAHRLGRVLHEIGDADLTTRVTAEVQAELKSVEQAELGDLSGRASQAVALTRADASPPVTHRIGYSAGDT